MNVKPVTHPSAEVLAAYGLGKLDEPGTLAVAQHLESCPECRLAVEKVSPDSFVGRVRGTPAPPSSHGAILVVDDEDGVRQLTTLLLEQAGYSVIRAGSGQEALAQLGQPGQPIRLVLLDLTMPEMDGVETFHAVHQVHPQVPVILMSGYNEQEATLQFTTGLAGFLHKPFQSAALLAKVREVLH